MKHTESGSFHLQIIITYLAIILLLLIINIFKGCADPLDIKNNHLCLTKFHPISKHSVALHTTQNTALHVLLFGFEKKKKKAEQSNERKSC